MLVLSQYRHSHQVNRSKAHYVGPDLGIQAND
jgi:hypothetical protein